MNKSFNEFTNQYSKSITLKNELIPVGKTLENIKKFEILKKDEERSNNYEETKKIIDNFHRYYIDSTLKNVKLDWNDLHKIIDDVKNISNKKNVNEKEKQKLEKDLQKLLTTKRKQLFDYFKKVELQMPNGELLNIEYKNLFDKELFSVILPKFINSSEHDIVKTFENFTTYFKGFNENRSNIYSVEQEASSLFYRLVDDNFFKFLSNLSVYNKWQRICPDLLHSIEKSLIDNKVLDSHKTLDDVFSVDNYNRVLRQQDIDLYNNLISGFAVEVGEKKIQGINEQINLAIQKDSTLKDLLRKNHALKMTLLFKQILSEKESKFVKFTNDEDAIQDSKDRYYNFLKDDGVVSTLRKIFSNLKTYDNSQISKIFVKGSNITKLSTTLFGGENWFKITEAIDSALQSKDKNYIKQKKNSNGEIEDVISKREFSLEDLNSYLNLSGNGELKVDSKLDIVQLLSDKVEQKFNEWFKSTEITWPISLKTDNDKKNIKEILDSLMNFYNLCSLLETGSLEKDPNFYSDYDSCMKDFKDIKALYNKVRNYCTKKPYSYDKFKLNFNCVQLASGWSDSKLNDYLSTIFVKNGEFFLGILNKNNRPNFKVNIVDGNKNCYQKIKYLFFKDFSKMLPKCSTQLKEVVAHFKDTKNTEIILSDTKKFKTPLHISREIFELNNPNDGEVKKFSSEYAKNGDAKVYKESLAKWIDFAKTFLFSYLGTIDFDYSGLKNTSEYNSLVEFYNDVDSISYKIDFENIDENYINDCVEQGKLFLFKIHNKDFKTESTGTKNLHTLYFLNIFSPENAKVGTIKLNGEAELFYRKSSIVKEEIITHKKGSKLVNRTYFDKNSQKLKTLTEEAYQAIYKYLNNKGPYPELYKEFLEKVEIKEANHDITKDKRFTENKFFFHCPITLNYKDTSVPVKFNHKVLNFLRENKDVNIIGIDRGERNLIYVSIINQQGKILEQRSFNTIIEKVANKEISKEIDYHQKLSQREGERKEARKNWSTIGNIKNLKEGYLSSVVHEIAKLVIDYNAIVVMENLNSGFKRIRQGISEKSVYQKFESMLIEKLNYLSFKSRKADDIGGVLKGYQLTNKFDTFNKLGLQSGILFYVNPKYTSKIDPTTGFANTLVLKDLTNAEDYKKFFSLFDCIKYEPNLNLFKFSLDFSREGIKTITTMSKSKWDIYSVGERIVRLPKNKDCKVQEITQNLTEELKKLFIQNSIIYEKGADIKEEIQKIDASKVNAKFWRSLFFLFKNTLQMRNSSNQDGKVIDYLISPIMNSKGSFFNSNDMDKEWPLDADANGAYHIALKGLMILERNNKLNETQLEKSYNQFVISDIDWFNYVQNRKFK